MPLLFFVDLLFVSINKTAGWKALPSTPIKLFKYTHILSPIKKMKNCINHGFTSSSSVFCTSSDKSDDNNNFINNNNLYKEIISTVTDTLASYEQSIRQDLANYHLKFQYKLTELELTLEWLGKKTDIRNAIKHEHGTQFGTPYIVHNCLDLIHLIFASEISKMQHHHEEDRQLSWSAMFMIHDSTTTSYYNADNNNNYYDNNSNSDSNKLRQLAKTTVQMEELLIDHLYERNADQALLRYCLLLINSNHNMYELHSTSSEKLLSYLPLFSSNNATLQEELHRQEQIVNHSIYQKYSKYNIDQTSSQNDGINNTISIVQELLHVALLGYTEQRQYIKNSNVLNMYLLTSIVPQLTKPVGSLLFYGKGNINFAHFEPNLPRSATILLPEIAGNKMKYKNAKEKLINRLLLIEYVIHVIFGSNCAVHKQGIVYTPYIDDIVCTMVEKTVGCRIYSVMLPI